MKKQDIFELISYGLKKDNDNFRKKVESILTEEKEANHNTNVKYLEKLLDARVTRFLNQQNEYFNMPVNDRMVEDYLYIKTPVKTLDNLELDVKIRKTIKDIIEEQHQAEKLEAYRLNPRSRILLEGPPGNGKTCLAEAIAKALELTFFVVRQEQIIDSHLGKTSKNLYMILSYAVKQPCVLFIDEFDALGTARSQASNDSREFNRIINTLLTEIEALPSYVIFIVATNRANILDKALWRRFHVSLTLSKPNIENLTHYYAQYIAKNNLEIPIEPTTIAEMTIPCNYADAEELMKSLQRKIILHDNHLNFTEEIKSWKQTRKEEYL